MKISYSILTHNETTTLEKLLKFLIKYKQPQDEIVILDDYSDNEKTKAILDFYVSTENIVFEQRNLLEDFASQKNYLKKKEKNFTIILKKTLFGLLVRLRLKKLKK